MSVCVILTRWSAISIQTRKTNSLLFSSNLFQYLKEFVPVKYGSKQWVLSALVIKCDVESTSQTDIQLSKLFTMHRFFSYPSSITHIKSLMLKFERMAFWVCVEGVSNCVEFLKNGLKIEFKSVITERNSKGVFPTIWILEQDHLILYLCEWTKEEKMLIEWGVNLRKYSFRLRLVFLSIHCGRRCAHSSSRIHKLGKYLKNTSGNGVYNHSFWKGQSSHMWLTYLIVWLMEATLRHRSILISTGFIGDILYRSLWWWRVNGSAFVFQLDFSKPFRL